MKSPFDTDAPLPDFKDGERTMVRLLIAIWGDSGAGKTRSGCALARGLAAEPGEDFSDPVVLRAIDRRVALIDTDAGRASHYMPAPGAPPRADRFAFRHTEMDAPYTSARLIGLCEKAVADGAKVIVIDSFSMLWDGPGGCQDWHQMEVEAAVERARKRYNQRNNNRWPFDEDYERDKASMPAWKKPKVDWRDMERRLLALGVTLVVCGHADDKLRIEKEKDAEGNETKKTKVIQPQDRPVHLRWEPIAEKKFKRRLSVSMVLTPEEPGVPHMLKKIDPEIEACIPLDRPLSANTGLRLAAWARGADPAALRSGSRPITLQSPPPDQAQDQTGQVQTDGAGATLESPPAPSLSSEPPAADDGADAPFPGDLIAYQGQRYDPARPQALRTEEPVTRMPAEDCAAFARALADLIRHAPTPTLKLAWLEENNEAMIALRGRGPSWVSRLEALAKASAGEQSPADGGASPNERAGGMDAPPQHSTGSEF